VIIALYEHFNRLEADRSILRLEMNRVIDENDWLRDELTDNQKRLGFLNLLLTLIDIDI